MNILKGPNLHQQICSASMFALWKRDPTKKRIQNIFFFN